MDKKAKYKYVNHQTTPHMNEEKFEFFKLDETDRKVLFWLMDHHKKAIRSWIEFIAKDYKRRRSIEIDTRKLYSEMQE